MASYAYLPGAVSSYSATFGGKPSVPDPGSTAASAISANIGNLGSLYQLGTGVSNYAQNQLLSNYNAAIPDYSSLAKQSSLNIGSELRGELPDDVVTNIINRAAERGIMTGTTGSANTNAALVKQLLGDSLGLTEMGERELSAAVARSPIAQPFDVSRMFVTPQQEQEAAMAASIYSAAPDPMAAALELEGQASGGGSSSQGTGGALPWYKSATHVQPYIGTSTPLPEPFWYY